MERTLKLSFRRNGHLDEEFVRDEVHAWTQRWEKNGWHLLSLERKETRFWITYEGEFFKEEVLSEAQ
jgi:hypothetical protein